MSDLLNHHPPPPFPRTPTSFRSFWYPAALYASKIHIWNMRWLEGKSDLFLRVVNSKILLIPCFAKTSYDCGKSWGQIQFRCIVWVVYLPIKKREFVYVKKVEVLWWLGHEHMHVFYSLFNFFSNFAVRNWMFEILSLYAGSSRFRRQGIICCDI